MKTLYILFFALLLWNSQGYAGGYIDNKDGTVTDWKRGLMWQQCSRGQSGSDCSDTSLLMTDWSEALEYCENQIGNSGSFAGYSDWKLPDLIELISLFDYSRSSPSIDSTFPNTKTSGLYWSATSRIRAPSSAWRVHFYYASITNTYKGDDNYVRCVRIRS